MEGDVHVTLHIRENFQDIYKACERAGFERALMQWYCYVTHCRIPQMIETTKTIKHHWLRVLRWFQSKTSNGILEGLNSLVQAAKSKARGYRTLENVKILIYMLRENSTTAKSVYPLTLRTNHLSFVIFLILPSVFFVKNQCPCKDPYDICRLCAHKRILNRSRLHETHIHKMSPS